MNKIKFLPKHIRQFRKIGIQTIYLFGSQAQGQTHPLSDFDFGIILERPEKYRDKTMDVYLKLYDIFTDILPKKYLRRRFKMRAHEFDIVFLQFEPISLQLETIQNSKVIYNKSGEAKFDYQENVMKRHADLQYFYDMRHKAILERI